MQSHFFCRCVFVTSLFIGAASVLGQASSTTRPVLPPPFTSPAEVYSGISGPGEPVQGDGSGGWRSGRDGVRYKGAHPKTGWHLDWDAKETSSDKVIDLGLIPPIKPIWELHLRDTSICLGGDGVYYMTGSSGDNIWDRNDGVELWKSNDLKTWAYVGLVWSFAKDATWQKNAAFVWAPEIHYIQHNYCIAFCVSGGAGNGTGILISSTGKPEGPYVNPLKPDKRATGGIDGTIFQDDDGKVYFTWGRGSKIYQMKDDLSGFADEGHDIHLDAESVRQARAVGGVQSGVSLEGASLFKRNGKYYLGGAIFVGGIDRAKGRNGRYSSAVAVSVSDNIYGPYEKWQEAVPCGGGGNYFQDKAGNWYCTYFGNDEASPYREKPGLVRIDFDADGKILIADEQPAFILRDGTPTRWRHSPAPSAHTAPSTQPS